MASSFEYLVSQGLITVTETVGRHQILPMITNEITQGMVVSETFHLRKIALEHITPSKRFFKKSTSVGPIIIDWDGQKPIILDGTHRWFDAHEIGQTSIDAWIGDQVPHLNSIDKKSRNQQFGDVLRLASKVAIFTHKNPDQDAIGSMVGLQWLLKEGFGIESDLFCSGSIIPLQCQQVVQLLKIQFKSSDDYNPVDYDLNILCDTIPEGMGPTALNFNVVIDHHGFDTDGFSLQVKTASCCSIIYNLIKEFCSTIDSKVALALLVGIRDDSCSLASPEVTGLDLDAYQELLAHVSPNLLERVLLSKHSKNCIAVKLKAFADVRVFNRCAIVGLGEIASNVRYVIAEIANELILWDGVDSAICHAIVDGQIHGFMRSLKKTVPVADLCRRFGRSGTGGGKAGEGSYSHSNLKSDETRRLCLIMENQPLFM